MSKASVNSQKWLILVRLFIIGLVYQLQHYVFSFVAAGSTLLEDLKISNFEYSLLSGPSTLLITAISIMPTSRFADRLSKPVLFLLICSLSAAVLTIGTGFVNGFWGIFIIRVLFSAVSAPISPINLRILTDCFGYNLRGTSSSLYFMTVYIGLSICSFMIYVCYTIGWRLTYIIIGSCSFTLSLIPSLTFISYKRTPKVNSVSSDIKSLFSNKTLIYSVLGLIFKYINQFIRASFESIYFARAFPSKIALYSILNTIFILLSPISSIIFGHISDKYEPTHPKIKSILSASSFFLCIPPMILMYLSENFFISIACLGVSSLLSEAYIGVSYSIMINVTKPELKTFQTAWMMSVTMCIGAASVVLIGFFYINLEDLRIGLVVSASISLALAGLSFLKVSSVYTDDLKQFNLESGNREILLNESI